MQVLRKATIYSLLYFLFVWALEICMSHGKIGAPPWEWIFHSDLASVLWPVLLYVEIKKKPKTDVMIVLATFLFCFSFMIEGVMAQLGEPQFRARFWQITWYGLLPIVESMPYAFAIVLGRKLTSAKERDALAILQGIAMTKVKKPVEETVLALESIAT